MTLAVGPGETVTDIDSEAITDGDMCSWSPASSMIWLRHLVSTVAEGEG